ALPLPLFSTALAPAPIYPLSLHDALPISGGTPCVHTSRCVPCSRSRASSGAPTNTATRAGSTSSAAPTYDRSWPPCSNSWFTSRSEEHTSELQSRFDLVCRLLLEKKKKKQ